MNKELLVKDILLKDICVRMSYGVTCSIYRIDDLNVGWRDEKLSGYFYNGTSYEFYFGETPISIDNDISKIKPYLRPMYSMTDEEIKEYKAFHCVVYEHTHFYPQFCTVANELNMFDWLNKKMFDYRGLISKGLALEAPEGMYT